MLLRRARLIIIECIPKLDEYEEGEVLYRFLEMTDPKEIAMKGFSSKKAFVRYLGRRSHLEGFNFVHLSGHGYADGPALEMPYGYVHPEDFPDSCFEKKYVTFSACGLSRDDFISPFMDSTGAKAVIAPRKDVRFDDAAIWYLTFYYLILHHRFSPVRAFDRVNDMLCYGPRRGRVKGGFEYWR